MNPGHMSMKVRHGDKVEASSVPRARGWGLLLIGLLALATGCAIYLVGALLMA